MALLALTPGCANRARSHGHPVRNGQQTKEAPRGAPDDRAPAWSTQPHSWGKLDSIERWLRNDSTGRGYWNTEAQLQLAEGQLRFAGDRSTDEGIIAFRRDSAVGGFQTVLTDRELTSDQRSRAQAGLVRARRLAPGVVPAATRTNQSDEVPTIPIGGLVRRNKWSASRADPKNMERSAGGWNWITVHHSVFGPATTSIRDSLDCVRRIQREHIDGQGYADIGYHYLIDGAGRVIEGRSLRWQGAHAGGQNNRGNAGICLLGNFETEYPTKAALASLDKLVLELQRKLRIPRKNVRPHSAWKETACPGKHLMPWFTRR